MKAFKFTSSWTLILALAGIQALMFSSTTMAADKKELQARFEKRYPQILAQKSQGKVGETSQGLLEAVESGGDGALRALINDENGDRRELYKIIADEEKTTPDRVAQRTAERNFEKARPGEYLKGSDGKWKKKS